MLTGLFWAQSAGLNSATIDSLLISDLPNSMSQAYKRASVVTTATLKLEQTSFLGPNSHQDFMFKNVQEKKRIPNENLFLDSRIIVVEGTAFKVPFKLVVLVALSEVALQYIGPTTLGFVTIVFSSRLRDPREVSGHQ